jgi:hypothetical protein
MASNFTNDIASLSSTLSFETSVFLMLWLVSFLLVFRQEAIDFPMFPMVFSPIRTLAYHTSADLGRFIIVKYKGPLSFMPSGLLESHS